MSVFVSPVKRHFLAPDSFWHFTEFITPAFSSQQKGLAHSYNRFCAALREGKPGTGAFLFLGSNFAVASAQQEHRKLGVPLPIERLPQDTRVTSITGLVRRIKAFQRANSPRFVAVLLLWISSVTSGWTSHGLPSSAVSQAVERRGL
jgi:hypothetical protein